MKNHMAVFLTLSLSAAILFPTPLSAQQRISFDQVRLIVNPGDTLVVIDIHGDSTKGKVERVSRESLRLITRGGVLEFVEKDVMEIQQRRRDRLDNGAKRGFIIGAVSGFVVAMAVDGARNEAPLAAAVEFGIYGAGIGIGIDALKKSNHTIYRAPATSISGRLRVAPLMSHDRKGALVNLSF